MISGGTLKYKDHIEEQKNKAIVDAQNSYAMNMPTYGSTAAALNNMGLAGSGYSDYLAGKAYSAYRSEVQNANNTYNANMLTYQQNQTNAYLDLLNEVENGGGSVDYINTLSDLYGYTPEQKTNLINKVYRNEAISGLEGKTFANASEVQNFLNTYIGDTATKKLNDEDAKTVEDLAATVIKANGFDTSGVTNQNIANALNSSTIHSVTGNNYDSLGNGDDITVEIGGKKYTVESKGQTYDDTVVNYANNSSLKDSAMFEKDGNVYIKNGEKVYKVGSKFGNTKWNEQFNDVMYHLQTGGVRDDKQVAESIRAAEEKTILEWAKSNGVAENKPFVYKGEYYQINGDDITHLGSFADYIPTARADSTTTGDARKHPRTNNK